MQAILIVLIVLSSALCAEAKKKSKHNRMALKTDLVAYWNMGQDPRLFPIHDQSGNGNHLHADGDGVINTAGKIGLGVIVPAAGNSLETVHSSKITHQGNPFTFAMWFSLPTVQPSSVSIISSDEYTFTVGPGTSSVVEINLDAFGTQASITLDAPAVGVWHFLAFGYYTDNGSFFWANMDLSDRVRVAAPSPPFAIFEGRVTLAGRPCIFDETAIWRRKVSAEELTAIYNDGDGLDFSEWDAVRTCKEIKCCDD